jgi:hypothetical protein
MPTIDASTVDEHHLVDMLRAWAHGAQTYEAATDLVITSGIWLSRPDFRRECVIAVDDGRTDIGHAPVATLRWHSVARYAEATSASAGDVAMLKLACSLAGVDTGSLRDLTRPLTATQTALLLQALAHRDGWQASGIAQVTTGDLGRPLASSAATPALEERGHVRGHRI